MKKIFALSIAIPLALFCFACAGEPPAGAAKDDSALALKKFGLSVSEGGVYETVQNKAPVNPKTEFKMKERIWTYTRIAGMTNEEDFVYHRYSKLHESPEEKNGVWVPYYAFTNRITSSNFGTYSYATAHDGGKYRIDILAPDHETVMATYVATVDGAPALTDPRTNVDETFTPSDLVIEERAICKNVVSNMPVDVTDAFLLAEGEANTKVALWANANAKTAPMPLYVGWSYETKAADGNSYWVTQYFSTMTIKATNGYRTYASKTVVPGRWRVDLYGADGKKFGAPMYFDVFDAAEIERARVEDDATFLPEEGAENAASEIIQ